MGKLTNLLSVIGLTPGIKATSQNLNFGKIVISTDSDPDGGSIFSLLVNMFYKYWPELFTSDTPLVYRLLAPNLVAYNKKERIYFPDMIEFNKVANKYKNHTVVYYKGLGSMEKLDWTTMLEDLDRYILPMEYDDNFNAIIKLLFSDNADNRKEWLT